MANEVIANLEIQVSGKGIQIVQKDLKKTKQTMDETASSAKKGTREVDKYGRGIKGAAGISSNASKNFSKMQQNIGGNDGSGGLVRAYALLAANVFALTAAFGVLQRSAQIDQLTVSMEILSTRGGTSIDVLSQKIVSASGGAIALADAFRQVSLASSAGLSTAEIEGLTTVAKGAAISLGRDLPDAMDRIFRGAIKLEPEILDEIGLFVRVDEASRDYARSLGRTVTSLSQADKRQAFLNAILEQGTKKFQEYAEAVEPDAFTQLAAALRDIAQNVTSLLNRAIGPFVNFLSDNKGLLTGLFVIVAGNLLKQAIPAIGQFNQGLAESAAIASKEAADYVRGVEKKANAAIKNNLKIEKSNKKAAVNVQEAVQSELATSRTFKSQAKNVKEIDAQLKKANTGRQKAEALEKKINQLEASRGKAKAQSIKLIDKELVLRRKELQAARDQAKAESEINRLRKGRIKSAEGSVAIRTQQRLDRGAAVAGGVALVSGVAETQGVVAGFDELKDVLKKGQVEVDGATKKLGRLGKASFAVRGSVSLLAVGFQSLMLAAAPFLIVGTAIAAVLYAIGKAGGVGREESKKLAETLDNSEKISSKLAKRFEAQVKGVNDSSISFIEQTKALTAYNNQAAEAANQILAINKDLQEFEATSTAVSRAWQGFLSIFGLDKESQAIQQQIKLISETLRAAFDLGDTGLSDAILEQLGASEEYKTALKEQKIAREGLNAADNAAAAAQKRGITDVDRLSRLYNSYKGNLEAAAEASENNATYLAQFTAEERKALAQRAKYTKQLETSNKVIEDTEFSQEQLTKAAERDALITTERTKRLKSFTSSIEGAKESIGKFQQAFLPRTKVDEVIGSLDGIQESFKKLTEGIIDPKTGKTVLDQALDPEKVNQFLSSFKDKDSPLRSLFTDKEIENIENLLKEGKTTEAADAIKNVTDEFYEFQMTVLTSKAAIAKLTGEIQKFTSAGTYSAEAAAKAIEKQTLIKTEQKEIAAANLQANIRSLKLEESQAKKVDEAVKSSTTHAELKQKIVALGISEASAMSLAAAFDEKRTKELEEQIALKQEDTLKEKARVQTLQKALSIQEKLTKATQQAATLQSDLRRGRTGVEDTNASAAQALENARKDTELKQKNLELQAQLQLIEFRLLDLQLQVLKDRGIITEKELEGYQKTLTDAATDVGEALRTEASNAGLEFAKNILGTMKAGDGGIVSLAKNLASAQQERAERIKDLKAELESDDTSEKRKTQIQNELAALNSLNLGYIAFKETLRATGEQLKKYGPEGEYAAAVVIGSANILDGLDKMRVTFDENSDAMTRGAAVAEFASTALGEIGNMMAANASAQIAEIDRQIAAEKKRDGKSKESLARINAMEKKKEAIARKNFEQQKKMQMAQAIMSTAAAIMQTAASNLGAPWAFPLMATMAAMGAMQLAVISKQKYNGPTAGEANVNPTSLTIGKRSNAIDVARGTTGGELNYLRGGRTTGTNLGGAGASFQGGAMGRRGYANGGDGVVVGERGPEIITPSVPVDITPNYALGGGSSNVNFTINAVDAAGVEDVLMNQRGNIIRMIREAANENGTMFLEEIDTQAYGSSR